MKRGGMLIAGIGAAGLLLAPGASAKTFEVTSTADPVPNGCAQGACTLREAVIAANSRSGPDEVSLKARKTYILARPGVDEDAGLTGDLDSTGRLTISARGRGARPVIDGADLDRILHLFAPARVSSVVIRNGDMSGDSETGDGGGIFAGGDLTLVRSVVRENAASDNGEGISADHGASITLIRTSVVENLGQGVREEDAGSIVLRRSRVNRNDQLGIEESGDGGVRLQRSRVGANGGSGIREFDDGGVSVVRSRILRNQGDGVDGSGPGALALNRAVVSGNDGFGVVDSQPTSRITQSVVPGNGSGVYQYSGALHIARTQILGNESTQDGGGITALSTALLRVDRSTVARNQSTGRGGGIFVSAFPTTSPAVITRSTISGNTSLDSGGGIYAGTPATIVNSTLSGNRAGLSGGGIRADGAAAVIRLNAATIVRNVANFNDTSINTSGGGINANNGATFAGTSNTLIALNRADFGASFPDCNANIDSGGHNLLADDDGCTGLVGSDLVRANPKIGRLRDNGGPTKTVALKKGSPAIGKAGNDAPNRDQRGVKRDNQPDIGAFER